MANCGKHFPGHGFADADSHVALPVDERGLDELLAEDAALVACFADQLPPALFAELGVLEPLRVVVRDSSFPDSAARINAQQMLSRYSTLTELRTI